MKIPIIQDYFLRADAYQWMISKHNGMDEKGQDRWRNMSFHASPRSAIASLCDRLVRTHDVETFTELQKVAKDIAMSLSGALSQANAITDTIDMNTIK